MIYSQAAALTFWGCASLVVYAYLGYPALVASLARWHGRRPEAPELPDGDVPPVSLLIAAHDEEGVIAERVRNALAMDYPREKLEIVVASDGSTDGTPGVVRRFARDGVVLLDYRPRRGKAAVLNASIPGLKGEVILFSDANTTIDPAAARRLVRWFRSPDVGAVCGRLVLVDPRTGRNADGLYWKYETFLKRCEARLGALLGANGAIYAIRKDRYVPIPDGTIVDDFVIPLLARLRTGCTISYDAEAIALEETPPDLGSEFNRRCRIGAGGFQAIGLLAGLLDPRQGWVAFTFLSHKVLRWLCPFFLIGLFASNLALLGGPPAYRWALAAQAGFYLLAAALSFVPGRSAALKPLRLATMFAGMNAALLVGFCRWLRGSQGGAWRRTPRLAETDGVAR